MQEVSSTNNCNNIEDLRSYAKYISDKINTQNNEIDDYEIQLEIDIKELKELYENHKSDPTLARLYANGLKRFLPIANECFNEFNLMELKDLFIRFPFIQDIEEAYAEALAYSITGKNYIKSKKINELKSLSAKYPINLKVKELYLEMIDNYDLLSEYYEAFDSIASSNEIAEIYVRNINERVFGNDNIEDIEILATVKKLIDHNSDNSKLTYLYYSMLLNLYNKIAFDIRTYLANIQNYIKEFTLKIEPEISYEISSYQEQKKSNNQPISDLTISSYQDLHEKIVSSMPYIRNSIDTYLAYLDFLLDKREIVIDVMAKYNEFSEITLENIDILNCIIIYDNHLSYKSVISIKHTISTIDIFLLNADDLFKTARSYENDLDKTGLYDLRKWHELRSETQKTRNSLKDAIEAFNHNIFFRNYDLNIDIIKLYEIIFLKNVSSIRISSKYINALCYLIDNVPEGFDYDDIEKTVDQLRIVSENHPSNIDMARAYFEKLIYCISDELTVIKASKLLFERIPGDDELIMLYAEYLLSLYADKSLSSSNIKFEAKIILLGLLDKYP